MYYFQDDIKGLLGEKKDAKVAIPKPVLSPKKDLPSPQEAPKEYEKAKVPVTAKNAEPVAKKEIDVIEAKLNQSPAAAAADQKKTDAVDWKLVRARVVDLLDDEKWDDGSWGPVFVRLAWHAAGTYDQKTKRGGSEGALMRFLPEKDWGANAGLAFARSRLESVKKEFPNISFADLWSFAGTVAIEEMGGPACNWRPGRKDVVEPIRSVAELPGNLLPDADGRDKKDRPADHLRDIFGRMGFNDREIVALSGAHSLGRCHTDRSGYWGPWTFAPTTVSNEYYRLLLEEKWTPKTTHMGGPWKGPLQYEDKTGALMMLPTDLALVQDAKMRPIVEEYAKDEKKFFADFAKAWIKLQELGVGKFHGPRKYWFFGPRE
jgi:cytochrome c peroxidase